MGLTTDKPTRIQSILHGSLEAKQEGDVQVQQHSKVIARGKYVHGFEGTVVGDVLPRCPRSHVGCLVHKVKPDAVEDYRKAAYVLPLT